MTVTALVPGLSVTDSKVLTTALAGDCDVRHKILNLDLSHQLVADIAPMWLDGQINIVAADLPGVTRTLQMGFYDPDHTLRLDSDTPTAGFGGLDRLVQVHTFVRPPGFGYWVGSPTFTGRPSVVGRDGESVTIEAQDKSCLHLRGVSAYTIGKRTNTVEAIKTILRNSGETRFRFPSGLTNRMAHGVHIGGTDEERQPWVVAWKLARGMGYQLFYDLDGFACLRVPPDAYAWELVEHGVDANTLSRVKVTTDLTTIRNRVVVTGRTTPHGRGRGSRVLTSVAVLPSGHPLSGQSLAVNGTPWYNTAFYDQPDIHTQRDADAFARARLNELSEEQINIETTAMPAYHIQGKDWIRMQTATGDAFGFRLLDASIPMGDSESGMTIGYQARVRQSTAGRLRKAA